MPMPMPMPVPVPVPVPSNSDLQPKDHDESNKTGSPKISVYEQSREERIKENLQRMQQLGLKDLSNSLLNSSTSSRRGRGRTRRGTHPHPAVTLPPTPTGPLRRSSRLQNATPVTYSEVVLTKKEELLEEDVELKLNQSEVYTEEHEKLLGNTERSWTLFVDGCGTDGRRIYDPVKGKTCHQCRQKTLGHRTHCSKCNMVQGQFCGDCLYMRYGEHVLEANENPNWVCPVCRGICNCSLCRQAKGWAPTGSLYRKISQMGFKSVAHYLIQTRRVQTNTEKNPDNIDQVSAKRSLSFPALEQPSQQSLEVDNQPLTPPKPQDGVKNEKKEDNANPEPSPTIIHENSARKPLLFPSSGADCEKGESEEINGNQGFSELESGKKKDDGLKCEHETELHFVGKELNGSPATFDCCTTPGKNQEFIVEPSPESIDGQQRQRCEKDNSHDGTMGVNDKVLDVKQREMQDADDNEGEGHIASESSQKLKKRPTSAMEHSADSIAERMKQRRRQGKDHDEHGLPGANESVPETHQVAANTSSGKQSNGISGTNVDCIARRLRPRNKIL